jgi:peptidoglycan/xylan/chitin deacetylase (PgdA/CDA1 family)/heat shock protein HslJ
MEPRDLPRPLPDGPASGLARRALAVVVLATLLVGLLPAPASLAAKSARVITRGPDTFRTVALTIDDGWHPGRCLELHDILLRHGVPATWFPNAVYVRARPAVWRRIAKSFPMANHGFSHRSLPSLSDSGIRSEIASNERLVERVTGRPMSKILRPPYGAWDSRVLRIAGALGYETMALWDVSSADTSRNAGARAVVRRATRGGRGSVILMHCGPELTPRALPDIITRYACDGFRFATLEDLLDGRPGVRARVTCPVSTLAAPAVDRPGATLRASGLTGRDWRLTHALGAGGTLDPVAPETDLSVRFGARQASGIAGCDVFSVPYTLDQGTQLAFGGLSRSQHGCAGDDPDPAGALLDRLVDSISFRVADDAMALLDADGREWLRFAAVARASLLGDWTARAVADGSGGLAAPRGTAPTAVFAPTGQVRGNGGCNAFVGGYSTDGERLAAGPLLAGDATCGEQVDALEARFLDALRSAANWELREGTLVLRDGLGVVVLELAPGASAD